MTGKFFIFLGVVFLIAARASEFCSSTPRGKAKFRSSASSRERSDREPADRRPHDQAHGRRRFGREKGRLDRGARSNGIEGRARPGRSQHRQPRGPRGIQSNQTEHWTDSQTQASLSQARANVTSFQAQLAQAKATLDLDELINKRAIWLFESGVSSAQDRDTADSVVRAARADVNSLEQQVRAQEAQLAVAEANRKQLDVQQRRSRTAQAQLQQAALAARRPRRNSATPKFMHRWTASSPCASPSREKWSRRAAPIVVVVDVDHLWVRADVEES